MSAACAAATVSIRWRVATTPGQSVIWQTPPALYLALDKEFQFTIDAAADSGNSVCDRYFDRETDALAQSFAGERVFCNPPYGRELAVWTHARRCGSEGRAVRFHGAPARGSPIHFRSTQVRKAMLSAQDDGALWVMVLPARTGVRWFHRYVTIFRPYRIGEGTIKSQPTFPGFLR